MGINGHSLTFEEKVLRRIEAKYLFDADGVSDEDIRKYMNTRMPASEILAIYSQVLEEVFNANAN